ncbi:MAG: hypothetical protein ACE5EQ_06110 [Phycisphaerae bacterium]
MKHFIDKHQTRITGTISCFDRILFKGHLPLSWDGATESFTPTLHKSQGASNWNREICEDFAVDYSQSAGVFKPHFA